MSVDNVNIDKVTWIYAISQLAFAISLTKTKRSGPETRRSVCHRPDMALKRKGHMVYDTNYILRGDIGKRVEEDLTKSLGIVALR